MLQSVTQRLFAFIVSFAALSSPAGAQTAEQANVIENTVALQTAKDSCGYKINSSMLAIALNYANLRTTDLMPGGKYWQNVQSNQARVRKLITTEAGKSSFCRTVRSELSAMLD